QDITEAQEERDRVMELERRVRQSSTLEALGRLAAGIAHDFNNALLPITAAAELLVGSATAPESKRQAAEILRFATRAASLPRRLQAFRRDAPSAPEAVDLSDCLRSMRSMLRHSLHDGIELELHLADQPLPCRLDPEQLGHACLNLLLNSQRAMPAGGRITLRTSGDEPSMVSLRVTDTGHGVAPADLERVFQPFFSTKAAGTGAGLGLVQVREFAMASGGRCDLTSAPGAGTSVTLHLPRTGERPEDVPPPSSATADDAHPSVTATVLVVDDNPDVLGVLVGLLEAKGCTVWAAETGQAARALFTEHGRSLDLLLVDVNMPDITGPELAAELAAHRPDLAVLFMSGGLSVADIGDRPFLRKPFSAKELYAAVTRTMRATGTPTR
ncbi:MAG: two-component system cell cycle sensor histidine kinase/response regulator CckA, partial [Myxococcota bacterium]